MGKNFLRDPNIADNGMRCIYYDLRTGKKYVEVHCLIDIRRWKNFLMQSEEEDTNTFGPIYYY